MRVLVTGGAGYIGTVLVPMLLENGYEVTVLDNLMFGGYGLLSNFARSNFHFIQGDVCDQALAKETVRDKDIVIHLAALVGYPLCNQRPELARKVNVEGTKTISRCLSKDQLVIYSSTGSTYGELVDGICTEETPVNPISLYGETKAEAERYLLDNNTTIALRFATAFGLSPRLRLDLLINDFAYQALKNRTLIVYEKHFKRTFIHIRDIARSFLFAINHMEKMKDEVYNIGSEKMNYTKEEVALQIREYIDYYLHFAEVGTDTDKRNYFVSYEKVRKLGFETEITLEEGIRELVDGLQVLDVRNPYSNV